MTSLNLRDKKGNIRATEIVTKLGPVEGPNVVLTDSEYDKLKDLSRMENSELNTGHKIYEVRIDINRETLRNWDKNGFNFSEEMQEVKGKLEGHKGKITVFRPRIKPLQAVYNEKKNKWERDPNEEISWEDYKLMLKFAMKMDFNWFPVFGPQIDSPDAVYRKRLQKAKKLVERLPGDITLIPHANMKADGSNIVDKFDSAAELGFDGVMLKMSSIKGESEKLSNLKAFANSEEGEQVFIYGANLPRYSTYKKENEDGTKETVRVSMRLTAPKFGVDLVGYENRTWGQGADNPMETKVNIPSTGTYWPAKVLKESDDEDHSCHAPCCGGNHPRDIIESSNNHDNLESRIWQHEVHSVKRQLKTLREVMDWDQQDEFYNQRSDIEAIIEKELS